MKELLGIRATTRKPEGSASLASCNASEVAGSVLAGVTARMRHVSRWTKDKTKLRICCSMSGGWSLTGTLVRPGRSMSVIGITVLYEGKES